MPRMWARYAELSSPSLRNGLPVALGMPDRNPAQKFRRVFNGNGFSSHKILLKIKVYGWIAMAPMAAFPSKTETAYR